MAKKSLDEFIDSLEKTSAEDRNDPSFGVIGEDADPFGRTQLPTPEEAEREREFMRQQGLLQDPADTDSAD